MKNAYVKNLIRTITKSMTRFLAILSIIALGVGFFAGLRVTKPSMVKTGNDYIKETNMYDFKIISTQGFEDKDIDKMLDLDQVISADGVYYEDFIYINSSDKEEVLKAISITDNVNKVHLVEGRMPEAEDECLVDAYHFKKGMIGKEISINDKNSDATRKCFKYNAYKVVGSAFTPVYMNNERGTTPIGSGRVGGFVFIPKDGFSYEAYKEAYVTCQDSYDIYTDEYDDFIADIKDDLNEKIQVIADERYRELLGNYVDFVEGEYAPFYKFVLGGLTGNNVDKPKVYVLGRNTNTGYLCFNNDASIVQSVAKVFPAFFFLIAALVCSTTMTRMVDEERNQIGTMRALGYSIFAIMWKYIFYSGLAAILGCLGGYIVGTHMFPFVIWKAYGLLYGFTDIKYDTSFGLLLVCLIVSLLCSVGTTYFACINELKCMPSELIRPKAPQAGKRILLERIPFIWKRLKFLYKVTARNIFRFKKRMLMMVIGIAGCMALVLTGLGVGDSVSNIADFQYEDIEVHDMEITFDCPVADENMNETEGLLGECFDKQMSLYKTSVEFEADNTTKTSYLIAADGEMLEDYMNFHIVDGEEGYPGYGDAMISNKMAAMAGLKVGDEIEVGYGDNEKATFVVSSIYENYVWHYIFINPHTYEESFGKEYEPNTTFVNLKENADPYEAAMLLDELSNKLNVLIVQETQDRIGNMMSVMDAVVWLVIACAGALAFIVLFNLSNINITERVREIATIKVLGFYPGETGAYVFRENLILTIMGIIAGIPLGMWLHSFVMSQINIDMIAFKVAILPQSYVIGVLAVIGFFVLVDLVMRRKIDAINMAESLKSIE